MEIPSFLFALREDIKDNKEFLPTRAHQTDTGWDVRFCPRDRKSIIIKPFQYVRLPLGIRTKMPDGWWLQLSPRSSSFVKKHLHFLYGTIDNGFENEMNACFQYIPDGFEIDIDDTAGECFEAILMASDLEIKFGEAIAQIIPVRLQQMNIIEISNDDIETEFKTRNGSRGVGGFGSTDNQMKDKQ